VQYAIPVTAGRNSNLIGDSSYAEVLKRGFNSKATPAALSDFSATPLGVAAAPAGDGAKAREFRIIHAIEDTAEFSMRKIPKARAEGAQLA
jgi:hypothetical protein